MESLSFLGALVQELTLCVNEIHLYAKPLQEFGGCCIGTSKFRLFSKNSREVSLCFGFVQRSELFPIVGTESITQ